MLTVWHIAVAKPMGEKCAEIPEAALTAFGDFFVCGPMRGKAIKEV